MINHSIMLIMFGFSLFLILLHEQRITQVLGADVGFIQTDGVQFKLNGAPFYANGFNAYWLMDVASNFQRSKVTSAFREAVANSLVIGRTWAFSDGKPNSLQPSPGVYNENWFQGLDFVISEARKFGVKLILTLVNNFDDYGGKHQYVEWAKQQGQQIHNGSDAFYTNPMVKGFYKNHIKTVLTRRNTITGVVYKDDSTIMAWELMNEPRCPSDVSGVTIQNWISKMGEYLKSIDGNHLLSVGLEGFYGPSSSQKNPNNAPHGTDFIANNQIPQIDFATVHSYPEQWLSNPDHAAELEFMKHWLHDHINDTQHVLRKPVLFGEFGKSSKKPGYNVSQRDEMYNMVYSSIYNSARSNGVAVGGLFWQQLVEGMNSYKDGYEVILTEPSSTVRLISQQSKKLSLVRRQFFKDSKNKELEGIKNK